MMEQDYRDFQAQSAQRYLQTALVIDDEAELSDFLDDVLPKEAVKSPAPDFGGPRVAFEGGGVAVKAYSDDIPDALVQGDACEAPQAAPSQSDTDRSRDHSPSILNFKLLSDEFLSRQIICTAYRPSANDPLVEMSARAAVRADIVIVDWFLRGKNAQRAKEVIRKVLEQDKAAGGRLRLIAVYTSQPGLDDVRKELFNFIIDSTSLATLFSDDGVSLRSRDTHIRFFNKAGTLASPSSDVVGEKELPSRLIREFASLSTGLMSTFALNSIASIRDAANHIISLFKPEIDGAYVSHHCTQKHPIDALPFAVDVISNELRNVLSVNSVAEKALGESAVKGWASALGTGYIFDNHLGGTIDRSSIDNYISKGISAKDNAKLSLSVPAVPKAIQVKPKNLINTFFSNLDAAVDSANAFARLTSFKREAFGMNVFPADWKPALSLGSVLRRVNSAPCVTAKDVSETNVAPPVLISGAATIVAANTAYSDVDDIRVRKTVESNECNGEAGARESRPLIAQEKKPSAAVDFLICVQPRCDSVRLGGTFCAFPFQSAERSDSTFNLVVRTSDLKDVRLLVNLKPRDAHMYNFAPDRDSQRVEAKRDDAGKFIFTSLDGDKFEWLGDLTDMKAQNFASAVGARVHQVGFDEFEWLRMHGAQNEKAT